MPLAANVHVIGDDRAAGVAHGLDLGDGEAAVAEHRKGFLQGVVQIVFERGSLLGRCQKACVHAIGIDTRRGRRDD